MADYRILIKRSAAKEIEAADPTSQRRRIVDRIGALAADPRMPGSEKLAGHDDRCRVRAGRYRIVYLIDDRQRLLTIYAVGHRKDVHR